MQHPDTSRRRRKNKISPRAFAAVACATAAVLAVPAVAYADPDPAQPTPAPGGPLVPAEAVPGAPAPAAPAPAAPVPGAPEASPVPAAPPVAGETPPAEPAPPPPEPGRVDNAAGGLSYVVPEGWRVSDQTTLSYGQALLNKIPPAGTEQSPGDTSILLGRLDLKLFAGAEADNAKAAQRLASDMGEFFMPFAGTRVNQQAGPLDAAGVPGAFSSYAVDFTDTTKPQGQIWAGVIGNPVAAGTPRGQRTPERWFVVWLGTANNPIDPAAATVLANSIRPFTPPPPPAAPVPDPNAPPADPNAPPADPNAPPADPNAPAARPGVGVPVPVTDAPPEMMPAG